jgi:hypothetical protein
MPIIWIEFSVDSAPEVHKRRGKPKELKAFVSHIVTRAQPGAKLLDLYFEVNEPRACALIQDLDDYRAAKAVQDILGAEYATKFLTAEQVAESNALRRKIIPRPPRKRPPKR